jgi:hypothetical protein
MSLATRTRTRARTRTRVPTPSPEPGTPRGRRGGGVVLVAGPDGTGKTTLCRALRDRAFDDAPVLRVHHRHGVGLLPDRGADGPTTEPHRHPPYPLPVSLAKQVYVFVDFLLAYLLRVRPFVRRGGWVLEQRTWWDMQVDPLRYRLAPGSRAVRLLGRALGRMLPAPDLVLVLEAEPGIVAARKAELAPEELERQMLAWRRLLPAGPATVYLDAARPAAEVARTAEAAVRAIAPRPRSVPGRRAGSGRRVDPRAVRTGRARTPGWVALPRRSAPRWTLPRGPRRVAAAAFGIYQPVTLRARIGWAAGRAAAGLGLFRALPRAIPADALRRLDRFVPPGGTVAAARAASADGFVALVLGPDARPACVAKVAGDGERARSLAAERDRIGELAPLLPPGLSAPEVLAHEPGLLVLGHVPWRPRRAPWRLPEPVAEAMGRFFRAGQAGPAGRDGQAGAHPAEPGPNGEAQAVLGPVHGDLAPWNLLRTAGGWALVDWEAARPAGPAFHDIVHFLFQAHDLCGRPRRRALLAGAFGRGRIGAAVIAYARGAGLDPAGAPGAFAAYLESSLAALDPADPAQARDIRTRRRLLDDLRRLGA